MNFKGGLLARQILAITAKELRLLWRDRQALALLFAMPAFFILVMSFALEGVFDAGSREQPLALRLVVLDRDPQVTKAVDLLKQVEGLAINETMDASPLDLEDAEDAVRAGETHMALVLAADFSLALAGKPLPDRTTQPVQLIVDPAVNRQLQSVVLGMLRGWLEQLRLSVQIPAATDLLVESIRSRAPLPGLADALLADSATGNKNLEATLSDPKRRLTIEVTEPRGAAPPRRPTSTEQNVPAYAIFGVFFIVLTLAKSFLRERADGTLARLRTAPVPKTALLAGKLAPYYLINLAQIGLMFAVGYLVFHMRLGNLWAFLLVSLATAAAANGLGLLVAAIGGSEARVDTLAVLLAITLAALGGIMVPAYVMPDTLQTLAQLTPHAWALSGYQDVIVRGLGVGAVLKECLALIVFAMGFALLGLWRLRLD